MQFWVYLLRCSDGSYYAGHTDNLEGRMWQHHEGLASDWTRRRRPVALVWCEAAGTREEALAFEQRIKGWTRAKKEALIAADWNRVSWLSRKQTERSGLPEQSGDSCVAEGGLAETSEACPSTSLRTNDVGSVR